MERTFPPLRLLALPQELRTKVYEELLCPAPKKVLRLWHDWDGRQGSLNLHPSILRGNKQIYHEAVSLLYDENIFGIQLTSHLLQDLELNFPDGKPNPPPLFRIDALGADSRSDQPSTINTYIPIEGDNGIICAHSLQRLRHIKLKTMTAAMWGTIIVGDGGNRYRAHGGRCIRLILQILQVLAEQECVSSSMQQTLHFEVVPSWRTTYGIFQGDRVDENDHLEDIKKLLRLLGEIKKKRDVLVVEKIKSFNEGGRYSPLKRVEVDVDARLAQIAQSASACA